MPGKKKIKKHPKKHHRKHHKSHAPEAVLSPLEALPAHILRIIFINLGLSDLAELMLVNKQFATQAKEDQEYWKQAHAHHFREEMITHRLQDYHTENWFEYFKLTYQSSYYYLPQKVKRVLTLIKSGGLERFQRETSETGYNINYLTSREKIISALATCPSQALRDYVYQNIILPHYTEKDKTLKLERTDAEAKTLIHWAAILNQLIAIKYFISIRANFCLVDSKIQLPLNYAILAGNLSMVNLLISHMGNFLTEQTELFNLDNIQPLQQAVIHQYLDIVKALVAHGLDPNGIFRGFRYVPPITIAAKAGNHDISDFLLSLSVDTNSAPPQPTYSPYRENLTALHYAVENQDIQMIQSLLEHKADIEDMQNTSGTPLMLAVLSKAYKTAECLLTLKANPNTPDKNQLYPIDAAAKTQNLPMLKLLLENGAIVDNTHGKTARHHARISPELTQTLHHAQLKQFISGRKHTLLFQNKDTTTDKTLAAAKALKAVVKNKEDRTTLKVHHKTLRANGDLKGIYKTVRKP